MVLPSRAHLRPPVATVVQPAVVPPATPQVQPTPTPRTPSEPPQVGLRRAPHVDAPAPTGSTPLHAFLNTGDTTSGLVRAGFTATTAAARTIAASATPAPVHPLSNEPARAPGAMIDTPLTTRQLAPVAGRWTGAPLVIHDNPESFSTPGVLGSTIAPVPGRGNGTYDLPGEAHLFTLANNRTGQPQRFSTVVHNTSDRPLVLDVSGTVYSKGLTPTDGTIPSSYAQDGGFRGPHAIAARSYLAATPGQNGYSQKTVTIPPGATQVVSSTGLHPGGEVFSMLDLRAREPGQTFRVASVASPSPLTEGDLARVQAGTYPTAGIPRDYAPKDKNKLGRPNGVVQAGSTFEGGRTVPLTPGTRTGDLFYATRFKNAGNTDEIGQLSPALGNIAGVGDHATLSDANYGSRHKLRYTLDNNTDQVRRVEVALTAPSAGEGAHRPLGGELTIPVKVDGRIVNARVNGRGEGRVLAVIDLPPNSQRPLEIELAHFGNTFPPAGVELRVR